jgi:23S rRNA G2445 N2-methylase RlmL
MALREALLSSDFTAPVRETARLLSLFADPDEEVVEKVERALLRAAKGGGDIEDRVVRELPSLVPSARARALRVLGALNARGVDAGRAVVSALSDGNLAVERAAAHALGRMAGSPLADEMRRALIDRWDRGGDGSLARAIAEALGKLGSVEAKERLVIAAKGDDELARIARRAVLVLERDGTRGEESVIAGERTGDREVVVILWCRAGLERFVREELRERAPDARLLRDEEGEVTIRWKGAPSDLMKLRTILGVAFPVPVTGTEDPLGAIAAALSSDLASSIIGTWTRGAVRYRIAWEGRGHKRGETWRLAGALKEARPTWVNDPTDSTWEVRVRRSGDTVLLVPKKLTDERFVYRVRDVPAASHPTIAAALVRASRPAKGDVVWDPFVGAGTELVERRAFGPVASLIGTDTDENALAKARQNGLSDALLELADATTYVPRERVNVIVTNPPMGRRVARDGSLADLLDAFTDHVAVVLAKGGRLAWLSPLGGRTAARAEANKLRVTLRQRVDMGGFDAELQVWEA